MYDYKVAAGSPEEAIVRIREIVARLRAPDGCPWDREQTLASLKTCLIEEAYELMDVMDKDDLPSHREELGDVLLQIIFQVQVREEKGELSFVEVVNELCDKLVRRHPHVFGEVKAESTEEVLANWEAIKKTEKGGAPRSPFAGIPDALPALLKTQRMISKANKSGLAEIKFNQEDLRRQYEEFELALCNDSLTEKDVGKLLFAIAGIAKEKKIEAENALQDEVKRCISALAPQCNAMKNEE